MAGAGAKLTTAYYELVAAAPGAEDQITKAIVPAASSAGDKGGKSIGQKLLGGLKSYAAPIAAALSVAAVGKFVKDSVGQFNSLAGAVNSLKRVTGGSAAEVSSLRGAMQLSGMDASKADTSLTILSKKLQAVQGDSKKTAEMQKLLGTSITNSDGSMKSMNQILPGIADKFKSMPDGLEKTALATQLFGKQGLAMVPFLNKGSAGISELEGKAKSLGITLDDQSMKTWGDYRASVRGVQTTMQGLKVTVGGAVLPIFTAMNNFISTSIGPGIAALIQKIKESDTIPAIMSGISNALGGVASTIGPLIPQLFNMASSTSMVGIVFQALGAVMPMILPLLGQLGSLAVSVLSPIFATLAPIISTVSGVISGALAGAVSMILPLIQQLTGFLQDNAGIVTAAVVAYVAWKAASGGIALGGIIADLVRSTIAIAANTAAWVANKVALIASKIQSVALAAMYAGEFVANVVKTTAGVVAQTAAWIAHGIALVATKVALGAAAAAQWLWNAAMDANPITLIIIAIAALVAGLVWFFTQTEVGRQAWSAFVSWLQQAWQGIVDFFTQAGQKIAAGFQACVDWVVSAWTSTVAWLQALPGQIAGFFAQLGAWIAAPFQAATQWAQGAFQALIGWFAGVPGQIAGFFGAVGSWIGDRFRQAGDIARGIWDGVVGWFASIPGRIGGFFAGIGGMLSAPFRTAFDWIRNAWNSTVGGFGFTVPDWIPNVGGKTFSIPRLAEGGTVEPKRGGTLALLGEAGSAETVVDTGKMNALMDMVLSQQQPTGGSTALANGDLVIQGLTWADVVAQTTVKERTVRGVR